MGAKLVIEYKKTTQELIAEFMEFRRISIVYRDIIVIKRNKIKDKTNSSESDKDKLKRLSESDKDKLKRFSKSLVEIHNHIKSLEKEIRDLKDTLADEEKWIVVPTIMEQGEKTTTRVAQPCSFIISDEDAQKDLDSLLKEESN